MTDTHFTFIHWKFTNLIGVKLDVDKWHPLFGITVVLKHAVERLRDILHDKGQKQLTPLVVEKKQCLRETTLEWLIERISCSSRQYLLNGHRLPSFQAFSLHMQPFR